MIALKSGSKRRHTTIEWLISGMNADLSSGRRAVYWATIETEVFIMMTLKEEIQEIIDRETKACDTQDV